MREALFLSLSFIAGAVLGAIFFGGLCWTVYRATTARQPGLWIFTSLLLRMALTLTGFYVAGAGHWERLLACLLGFVIARGMVTWLAQPASSPRRRLDPGGSHAP
ncbi:ATP synthase subunit I [Variovorax sp. dw_308]|uniref:ATP synthase subunit I n=1 Tax=Variovorax sp. dw_308 TaxID=2721546 RepID=UPI001C4545FC|nr:ATP synthase subunit I [Variovorax sp. dw_308]